MSDTSQGNGWWQASDGKWYAPELHPDYVAPVAPTADAPVAETPAADAPAADAPAADAPAADAPAGDAPAGDAPAGDAPAETAGAAAEVPASDVPADATLADTPVAAVPGEVSPAPIEPPAPYATHAFGPPPTDDLPPVPPIPPGPPPIGLTPAGPPPGEGGGSKKKPLLIALVVIAVLAIAGAAFALTRGDDDNKVATKTDSSDSSSSKKKSSDSDSSSSKKTTTTKKPSTTSTAPTSKKANLTIVTGGASTDDGSGNIYATAGATLTNPDTKLAAYNIKVVFNMNDAAGTVIDTESTTVDYIGPGKTVFVAPSYFSVSSPVAKVEVQAVGDLKPDTGYAGADYSSLKGIPLTVVDAALVPDPYSPSITVHVSNPGTEVADYGQLTCLLFTGTAISGGTTTYLDTIVPGGTVQADAYLDFIPAGVDGVQCQAVA